ncbi:tetratricopeptide repeat protein [Caryophanon tenue]|uniref:Hydrolase n=1 Tax=Caryophanon tenue TaxID=33978 RepID=A0A1C0YMN7_9BACL|nr:tetratricopeptide repeat protein [Caryophanon tenue]OCS88421.1 hypothetical protein A6M13_00825 [Caryophanon tenue]
MKRKEPLQKKGNMILLPGVIERILDSAHEHAEHYRYDQAVEEFEKAFGLSEPSTHSLLAYAYCLYEVRRFQDAREICEQVLTHKNIPMVEVMELYLTVCMELKDYAHVTTLATSLLQQSLEEEQRARIERILMLNQKIVERMQTRQTIDEQLDEFLTLNIHEQDQFVSQLFQQNIRPYQQHIVRYIETESLHPLIRAMLLTVLAEQQIDVELVYPLEDRTITINPTHLPGGPFDMPQYSALMELAEQQLDDDPTKLEMVLDLIKRHALYVYPLDWESICGYTTNEMLDGYVDYVEMLFGKIQEMDVDLIDCIQRMEISMNIEM